MIPYRSFCPSCMDEQNCLVHQAIDYIKIREEDIEILSPVITCSICGEDFNDKNYPNNSLEKAFEYYRVKHNLLQPEEIKRKREEKGWSVEELANLSGINKVSLKMYEEGSFLIPLLDSNALKEVLN